jgi:hypothetical protein
LSNLNTIKNDISFGDKSPKEQVRLKPTMNSIDEAYKKVVASHHH